MSFGTIILEVMKNIPEITLEIPNSVVIRGKIVDNLPKR